MLPTLNMVYPLPASDDVTVPTWRGDAIGAIGAAAREASLENWDGEGGSVVDAETIDRAIEFARLLPPWCPEPEISADRDGDISFDWDYEANMVLAVSVRRTGEIHYAALFGENRIRGREHLRSALPDPLIYALRMVSTYGLSSRR
jgi:hypothetical protein